MKKNFKILIITVLAISGGCQKLDREIVTTVSKDQFVSNYGLVSGLLTSVYSELPDGTLNIGDPGNGDPGNAMRASATDEAEFTQDTHPVQLFNNGGWNAINNPDNIWGKYYRGIRKANQLIVSTDKIDNDAYRLDPTPGGQAAYKTRLAEIKRWTFEARFLRAYYYFELVKRYGGVPLITQELSVDADISQLKRNTLAQCIDFIVSECDAALAQLPPYPDLAAYTATDLGRATKYAALALKSRVLLYAASDLFNTTAWAGGYGHPELIALPAGDRIARWKAASDAAKACIDAMGVASLTTSYKALFNTFNNPEIIFTRSNAAGNAFEKANYPIGFASGNSGNTPSQDLVDAYEVRTGTGATATSVPFDWNNPAHVANIYNYSTTSAVGRDPRMGFTVANNGSTFGTPARAVQSYTGGLDGPPINFASKTGYYLRKYIIESLNISSGNTGVHSWIIFRVPEMYLNYAEALNEWSPGNADIKTYVDKVRARTGVGMPPLPAGLSQVDMRARIRNEERVEFAFEDHRFWDIRRWMIAADASAVQLHGVTITPAGAGSFTYQPYVVESRVFTPKMYLYPIPQTEINNSRVLFQNPLW